MQLINLARAGAFALALVSCGYMVEATSLDGTSSLVFKNNHYVFRNGDIAQGFVRLNKGLTILSGQTASFDTLISVSGDLDLRGNGQLQLLRNLTLDAGCTLTSGGQIKGRGNTVFLKGSLVLPASNVIYIAGDTTIDGQGNTLNFDTHAQLFIDSNVTLTLRNMTIKNSRNNSDVPWIRLAASSSKLALDDVVFVMNNDFDFKQGQLYIHNDVAVTGSHAFIYHSAQPSFIAPTSRWYFDINTCFSFAPMRTATNNLITLQNASSTFEMYGCSVRIPDGSLQFNTGKLILDGELSLHRYAAQSLSTLSTLTSVDYGNDGVVGSSFLSPDGKFLAIAGGSPSSGAGGFANTDGIRIYQFDGAQLVPLTSQGYGTSVITLAWRPDGKFVAVGGTGPTNGLGGFSDTNELRIYSFDGSSLTAVTSKDYGSQISTLDWSPDGKFIAVGGINPTNGAGGFSDTNELRIYSFDGSNLTAVTSKDYGSEIIRLAWHPSGQYIVIGGYGSVNGAGGFANNNEVRLYQFDGSTLAALDSVDYGSFVKSVAWSPDGTVLAIGGNGPVNGAGGFNNNHELRLYTFNGSSLTALTSQDYGSWLNAIAWHPSGKILAITGYSASSVGGFANNDETRVYAFDGSSLTAVTSKAYGDSGYSIAWDPSGTVLIVGGYLPTNGAGGFNNTNEVRLYQAQLYNNNSPATYARITLHGTTVKNNGIL